MPKYGWHYIINREPSENKKKKGGEGRGNDTSHFLSPLPSYLGQEQLLILLWIMKPIGSLGVSLGLTLVPAMGGLKVYVM